MKHIYLIRHAKSDWNNPKLSDFNRPLNKRGKRNAPFMGQKLNELTPNLDLIIASPAKRALQTVKAICKEINYNESEIRFDESVYHSSYQNLNKIINDLDNNINTIALVGHNPGLTNFSNYLTNNYIDNIVTCGIVKIEFDIDNWNEIIEGLGTKVFYIYPKMYE